MPETFVLCGGVPNERRYDETILLLDVDAPLASPERVNLNIGQITRPMVADIPDRLVDLLEIAAYVYAADQFVGRGGRSMVAMGVAWRRDFRFTIPVRDLPFWRHAATTELLVDTLSFLSDDYYAFYFAPAMKPRPLSSYLDLHSDGAPGGFDPERVALFSGGLDSLAGAVTALLQRQERVALVSHHASPMIWSRQSELIDALRSRVPAGRIFHVGVTVTKGQGEAREFTQRSRSFLFACLALVVARLFRKEEISFYENGVVSLNLPLAEHILGVRATRTTHPKVLADFSRLFSHVSDTPVRFINPYFWITKAEVLHKIADADCADLIARSFSCSHVRLATQTGQQCGVCTQCLDRRFAVLATGMDEHDPANGYIVDLLRGPRDPGPELTLAESYVVSAFRFSSMTQTAFFARYGQVFRALPYLEGTKEENAIRIYELHRRHGRAVRDVIEDARARTSIEAALQLPESCLLSLVQSTFGSPGVVRDVTENEPPLIEQAMAISGPDPVARPIAFLVQTTLKQAVFADRVTVKGVMYELIANLLPQYVRDLSSGLPRHQFGFTHSQKLAEMLGIETPALRQRMMRFRQMIAERFLTELDVALADDDLIETAESGKGYRLNPFLVLRPLAGESGGLDPNVTPYREESQHQRKNG